VKTRFNKPEETKDFFYIAVLMKNELDSSSTSLEMADI
jgi:hypothetical protein